MSKRKKTPTPILTYLDMVGDFTFDYEACANNPAFAFMVPLFAFWNCCPVPAFVITIAGSVETGGVTTGIPAFLLFIHAKYSRINIARMNNLLFMMIDL